MAENKKEGDNNRLFTLTTKQGDQRDVFENDLDDKSRPIALDLSRATALHDKMQPDYLKALDTVQLHNLVQAYISDKADQLLQILPTKIKLPGEDKK
jgi:hypothetical protein